MCQWSDHAKAGSEATSITSGRECLKRSRQKLDSSTIQLSSVLLSASGFLGYVASRFFPRAETTIASLPRAPFTAVRNGIVGFYEPGFCKYGRMAPVPTPLGHAPFAGVASVTETSCNQGSSVNTARTAKHRDTKVTKHDHSVSCACTWFRQWSALTLSETALIGRGLHSVLTAFNVSLSWLKNRLTR